MSKVLSSVDPNHSLNTWVQIVCNKITYVIQINNLGSINPKLCNLPGNGMMIFLITLLFLL